MRNRSSLSSAALAGIVILIIVIVAVGGYMAYVYYHKPTTSTTTTTPQVTLVIATYTGAPQQFLKMVIPMFEATHPGVTVQVDA
ncbi:MAG: carbohydrate ABC transporter substrate-binding protein, partial [Acidilobus sp.]